MKDYLQKTGFMMTEKCMCGGTLTETWQLPVTGAPRALIVEIKPNRESFKVLSASPTLRGRAPAIRQVVEAELVRMKNAD